MKEEDEEWKEPRSCLHTDQCNLEEGGRVAWDHVIWWEGREGGRGGREGEYVVLGAKGRSDNAGGKVRSG